MPIPTHTGDTARLASERSRWALLLIDVINDFEFEGGDRLLRAARPMARAIAKLRLRAARAKIPVVYVNDNFGRWRSDFRATVNHCASPEARGREIVEALAPTDTDYFVLKPANSAFFCTALEVLLGYLGADTLILTGLAADNCVLFTAHDAYLRQFRLFVPADCVASRTQTLHRRAMLTMSETMKANVCASARIPLTDGPRRRTRGRKSHRP